MTEQNSTVKIAEDLAARKVETDEIKSETSKLAKMLKTGFDGNLKGFDKVINALSISNSEPEKLKSFYDMVCNIVRCLELTGNLEKFNEYAKINFSVEVSANTSLRYNEKKKKFAKFRDLYSEYFFEEPNQIPNQSIRKILDSMIATSTEYKKEECEFKQEVKAANENLTDCSPLTFKTMTNLLVKAKKKGDLDEVLSNADAKLSDEQQAVTLLESEKEK